MLSVLVYGRNDSYGYNLHKRAAISLNTFAALLDHPQDEIVFVDYNTPDDFPTFPEAIRDTLTPRARSLLRILRVRPDLHEAHYGREGLKVVEPFARNIGLRRTNLANRWVLSTNTDIIVGMRNGQRFGELVTSLDAGFYQAPRIEIPESLWESFDRAAPQAILKSLQETVASLHLDEIVYGNDNVLFDGPGDFQLFERQTLFDLDGFDERMSRGWHVDANLAVRLARHCGGIRSLQDHLFAYHCDHTRQVTPLHCDNSHQNSIEDFVTGLSESEIPTQRSSWGVPDSAIEEISLMADPADRFVAALQKAIGPAQTRPYESGYRNDTFNSFDHDFRHVLPFLADLIVSTRRDLRIGWVGTRPDARQCFDRVLLDLGFDGPTLAWPEPLLSASRLSEEETAAWLEQVDLFVLDFGSKNAGEAPGTTTRKALGRALFAIKTSEWSRISAGLPARRVIGIDVVHNSFELAFRSAVAATAAPFSTRVRVGYVRPPNACIDWIELARREPGRMSASATGGKAGMHLFELAMSGPEAVPTDDDHGCLHLRITADDICLVDWRGQLDTAGEGNRGMSLPFWLDEGTSRLAIDIAGTDTVLDRITYARSGPRGADFSAMEAGEAMVGQGRDWLPHMTVGKAGARVAKGIAAQRDIAGHVMFGPYWCLAPGTYLARLEMDGGETQLTKALISGRPLPILDVRTSDGEQLARRFIRPRRSAQTVEMPFSVTDSHLAFPIEIRLYASGASSFTLRRLIVERL